MAEIVKENILDNPVYTTYAGPLDAKTTPVDYYDDLKAASRIPVKERYIGLTIVVLNPAPTEYWLVGGTRNPNWKIKTGNIVPTKNDLLAISASACTVGLEMIVQSDETNENKVTKYWVTAIDGANVTWEQKIYGGGASVPVEGEDQEINI